MRDFIELTTAIPNFLYDLISRLIPGAIVVFLLRPNLFQPPPDGIGLVVLIAGMWAAGLVLDYLTASTVQLRKAKRKKPESDEPKEEDDDPVVRASFCDRLKSSIRMDSLGTSIYSLDAGRRSSIIRAMADRTFFRSMFAIACVFIVYAFLSKLSESVDQSALIVSGSWLRKYPALGWTAPIFVICWVSRGYELNREIHEAKIWLKRENARIDRETKAKDANQQTIVP